jgi:hypothetical protein
MPNHEIDDLIVGQVAVTDLQRRVDRLLGAEQGARPHIHLSEQLLELRFGNRRSL